MIISKKTDNLKLLNNGRSLTALRYPGGKARIISTIIKFLPAEFLEYREPLVGGGSLFLYLKSHFPEKKYWINDINSDLMSFWISLKDNAQEFVEQVNTVKSKNIDGKSLYLKLRKEKLNSYDTFQRGIRFFILNRISYSGLVDAGGYSKESFNKRFTDSSIGKLLIISKLLKGVRMTSQDYKEAIKKPGNNIFIFLDPPYENAKPSKLYGKGGKNGIYFNRQKLGSELMSCHHKWLLTYDYSADLNS